MVVEVAGILAAPGVVVSGPGEAAPKVLNRIGKYPSPTGRCVASLAIDEGSRLVLRVSGCRNRLSENVTGIAWITRNRLVFTSSAVYGIPGLFLYVCGEDSARAIVKSRRNDPWYPDGCDDFELIRVGKGNNPVIIFRWFAHIDSVERVDEGGVLARVRADGRELTGIP